MKLYWNPMSGHAHRAHMLLSMLEIEFELIMVNLLNGEQQQPDFLALNPFGQIPVLVDGEIVIYDSNAILVYLARVYDKQQRWLPQSPTECAFIEQFLSLAANRLAGTVAKLRWANLFDRNLDRDTLTDQANKLFTELQGYLQNRQWLVGEVATIADLAFYSYTKLAPEGGINLSNFPAIEAWLQRVEILPNFVPMKLSNVGLRQEN